jgi:hypothetical protein
VPVILVWDVMFSSLRSTWSFKAYGDVVLLKTCRTIPCGLVFYSLIVLPCVCPSHTHIHAEQVFNRPAALPHAALKLLVCDYQVALHN